MELLHVLKLVWLINLLTVNAIGADDPKFRFMRKSLFPNVSPYIRFEVPPFSNETTENIPKELKNYLQFEECNKPWQHLQLQAILEKSGFKFSSEENTDWMGSWNKWLPKEVKEVNEYQKIVHTPGHIWLGGKGHQQSAEVRMIKKYGPENFPFILPTFILPKQFEEFKLAWEKTKNKFWILKPIPPVTFNEYKHSVSRGVKPIKHWNEAQRLDYSAMVAQKYVHNPIIFRGRKVEIRLFVVITSFNPLKVFLSERRLGKLGFANYSASPESINDLCMHTRIHRKSDGILCEVSVNNVPFELAALIFQELGAKGHNITQIHTKMEDAVIKYIISAQPKLQKSWEKLRVLNRYNLFALYGFDFILDEGMNPWCIEINTRPELRIIFSLTNPVIELPLVAETLNLVGFHLPPYISKNVKRILLKNNNVNEPIVFQKQLYSSNLTKAEKSKQRKFIKKCETGPCEYMESILKNLTPDDVRQLIVSEDELARSSSLSFKRLFPGSSPAMEKYISMIEPKNRYYFMLFHAWETKYKMNRESGIDLLTKLAVAKYHLKP